MSELYFSWATFKHKLNGLRLNKIPLFSEREIWWCSIGLNVGFEIFGKSDIYTRPVLIIKKYGRNTFLGLPISSSTKDSFYRYHINSSKIQGDLLLDQPRVMDARRLSTRIQKLGKHEFSLIREALKETI
tara:strand:- start:484 stop:873 length:390 start_codon:yes stop_codon:yes gene_type:complete